MLTLGTQISRDVHGYLVDGWWDDICDELEGAISVELGITMRGNPDVVRIVSDAVGVDDARGLSTLQSRKASETKKGIKVFLVAFRSITIEAQNALLKILEEPTKGSYFFIVTPSTSTIVSTLQSRLRNVSTALRNETNPLVNSFLLSTPSKRLDLLSEMIKDKDKKKAHAFLDSLLLTLYQKGGVKNYRALENVLHARRNLPNRGASMKLLLEHVALVIPSKLIS